jgi:pilus assembly protein Flp/PilA
MIRVLRSSAGRKTDEGASAVEYGLLVAAIAAVIVALVFALGSYVRGAFQNSCDAIAKSGVQPADSNAQCDGTTLNTTH